MAKPPEHSVGNRYPNAPTVKQLQNDIVGKGKE
jgi:hypothetical protein